MSRLHKHPRSDAPPKLPKLWGIARDGEEHRAIALAFERPITDAEMRLLHEHIRKICEG